MKESLVCGRVSGVWTSLWCVEESLVCGGVSGVWRSLWCVKESQLSGKVACVRKILRCVKSLWYLKESEVYEESLLCERVSDARRVSDV